MIPLSNLSTSNLGSGISVPAPIKAYSKKDLIKLYNIPEKSLAQWLRTYKAEIGERRGHFYTVMQIEYIFLKLGRPYVEG